MKNLLLALSFVSALFAQTPNVISKGYFPDKAPVDANSPAFKAVVDFLSSVTGITPVLAAHPVSSFSSGLAPHVLEFTCPNSAFTDAVGEFHAARVVSVDAVGTFYNPDITVGDVVRDCRLPAVNVRFVRPTAPVAPVASKKPTARVSFVGAHSYACNFYALPDDPTKPGVVITEARGKFTKHVMMTPFGPTHWYFQNGCK